MLLSTGFAAFMLRGYADPGRTARMDKLKMGMGVGGWRGGSP